MGQDQVVFLRCSKAEGGDESDYLNFTPQFLPVLSVIDSIRTLEISSTKSFCFS